MSYHIYKTEGVVLGGYDQREGSRSLALLTRELGFIIASAQGIREVRSKLRYSLQNFSHSRIDLVRGKAGWRVVNAGAQQHFLEGLYEESSHGKRATLARVTLLLRRLLRGEEAHEKLFNEVVTSFSFVRDTELSEEDLASAEAIVVMRILHLLGYWGDDERFTPFLEGEGVREEDVFSFSSLKPFAIGEINKALHETQL